MARNAEAVKVLASWAGGTPGNREPIPDALRANGWDARYSMPGGLVGPERLRFNQLLGELSALLAEVNKRGMPLPWTEYLNYRHEETGARAFVMGDDGRIHVSVEPSGPATNDAVNPTAEGQSKWRLY